MSILSDIWANDSDVKHCHECGKDYYGSQHEFCPFCNGEYLECERCGKDFKPEDEYQTLCEVCEEKAFDSEAQEAANEPVRIS